MDYTNGLNIITKILISHGWEDQRKKRSWITEAEIRVMSRESHEPKNRESLIRNFLRKSKGTDSPLETSG